MVNIVNSSCFSEPLKDDFAKKIFELSAKEPNILQRDFSFFVLNMRRGMCNIAINASIDDQGLSVNNLVGAVFLNELGDNVGEISAAWVDKGFRSQGIYSLLKSSIVRLAEQKGLKVLGTTKPSSKGGCAAIVSSAKYGVYPVSFDYLKEKYPNAYKRCCSCSGERNYNHCDIRDIECILSIKDEVHHETLSFQESSNWMRLVNNDTYQIIKTMTKNCT